MSISAGVLIAVVTLLAVLIGAVGTSLLWQMISAYEKRLAALESDLQKRQEVLDKVQALKKHHSYSTLAGLEDAMAVLLDVQMQHDAEEARLRTALGILQTLRQGPHAYDQDRPAGKRE